MPISIEARFSFRLPEPGDVLLQFEAAGIPEQRLITAETRFSDGCKIARIAAEEDIGERIWLRGEGVVEVEHRAEVAVTRLTPDIAALAALSHHALPGETVRYLFDSRYCPADSFQSFVQAEFEGTSGGARIAAIRDWIAEKFSYEPGSSTSATTARDSFVERRGICRDYAHVLVTLARASAIPARFVSAYAPGVEPPDFHAVAEVFLADSTGGKGGAWHLVDATDMADPAELVKIGVGRDAADVSFLTSFAICEFLDKCVSASVTG
jgi:transglutaminase-like putative cysteine protease